MVLSKEKMGLLIKKCRLESGYTQKQLAEKVYVSETAVSKWERGKCYPDFQIMQLLCDVIDLPFDFSKNDFLDSSDNVEFVDKLSYTKHPYYKLKELVFVLIYILLLISVFAIIVPYIMLARNLFWIIVFILSLFITSMIVIKLYGNKSIEEKVWTFWVLLYFAILGLSFCLTKFFNYYVDPYWDNFCSIVPFKTISDYLHLYFINAQEFTFINYYLLSKVYLTIPFPIMFGIRFNKKFWFIEILILCLLYSLCRELYQYFSGNGVFDIDDIILNLIGCCIGVFICIIYKKISFKFKKE